MSFVISYVVLRQSSMILLCFIAYLEQLILRHAHSNVCKEPYVLNS